MRVANPDAIRKGEKALAEAIASNFDRSVVQKIFKRVHNLDVGEDIKCKNASMGVHGEKIAYSMDFEVLVNLSVYLDRSGNFISISSSGVDAGIMPPEEKPMPDPPLKSRELSGAGSETETAKDREAGASASEGTFESVLKEFVPLDS